MQHPSLKVLVVGATGGTGRAAVSALLEAGHEVTAFSRHPERIPATSGLTPLAGDATLAADVDRAVRGHDVVVVTLGISENPIRVRLLGSRGTPMDVRSAGTRNVITAMKRHGVQRLVVQSSYGVGPTRGNLRFVDRLFFKLLLAPQIADTELQEQAVRASGLDWVIAQPVHLTDDQAADAPFVSPEGKARKFKVSRTQVARFLRDAIGSSAYVGQTVAVAG